MQNWIYRYFISKPKSPPKKTSQLFIVIISQYCFGKKKTVIHQWSKYIDIEFQFICGSILLEHIETEKTVDDVFMKPMTGIKLNTFRKIIVDNLFLT